MKARRFGYFNYHPDDKKHTTNLDLIKAEMDDVVKRFNEYEKFLMGLLYNHFKKEQHQITENEAKDWDTPEEDEAWKDL